MRACTTFGGLAPTQGLGPSYRLRHRKDQAIGHQPLKIFQHGGLARGHREHEGLSIRLPQFKPIRAIGLRPVNPNPILAVVHFTGRAHAPNIGPRRGIGSGSRFDTLTQGSKSWPIPAMPDGPDHDTNIESLFRCSKCDREMRLFGIESLNPDRELY